MPLGWADRHILELQAGRSVSFRPKGNSMTGYVPNGALVTVEPLSESPKPGQIVLCRVRGAQYLHFVAAVSETQARIENAKGRVNGWTAFRNIYGFLTTVDGRPYHPKKKGA